MLHYHRLHWFPFCPSDWIARMSIAGISIPGQGALLRLMCVQWIDGSISSDPEEASRSIGGYAGEGFLEAYRLFIPRQGHARKLFYPPLEAAREEVIIKAKKRRDAGKKGASIRWAKSRTNSRTDFAVENS